MTREEILAMDPGRELDALVAEEVMGLEGVQVLVPREYSTSISAAWEVVEKMESSQTGFFQLTCEGGRRHSSFDTVSSVEMSNAPEAICKAALLAALQIK